MPAQSSLGPERPPDYSAPAALRAPLDRAGAALVGGAEAAGREHVVGVGVGVEAELERQLGGVDVARGWS